MFSSISPFSAKSRFPTVWKMYSEFMWASTSGEGAEAGDAETAAALVLGHGITAEWLY